MSDSYGHAYSGYSAGRTATPPRPLPGPTPTTIPRTAIYDQLKANYDQQYASLGARPMPSQITIGGGGGGGGAPSLLQQAGQFVGGVLPGIGGLVKEGAISLAGPFRLAYDVIRDPLNPMQGAAFGQGAQGISKLGPGTYKPPEPGQPAEAPASYFPLIRTQAESMERTIGRIAHPSRYGQASQQGTIVGAVLEDVANLSLAGGAGSKLLGRAPIAVEAGAAEAPYIAGETAIKSVGAMPLTVEQALSPVARTTFAERGAIKTLADLAPTLEAPEVLNFPGRGLAGVAYASGRPGLGAGLARAGEILHTYSQFGERAANAPAGLYTYVPKKVFQGIEKLGGPDIPQAVRSGITNYVERAGSKGGILFPYTEAGRQLARINSYAERLHTEAQREAVVPARLAAQLKLTNPAARAALFLVDQAMYPIVENLRQYRDRLSDADIDALIQEEYLDPATGKPVDRAYRPSPQDVRTLMDYADGTMEPELKAKIDQVTNLMGEQAKTRRDRMLAAGLFKEEQLGTEPLPSVVTKYQGVEEVLRNRQQKEWEKLYPQAVHAARISAAYDAIADQLPEPTRFGDVAQQGSRIGRTIGIAEERYNTAARDLASAVDEYERLSEGKPSQRATEAGNRVARLTARLHELRADYERVARREQAATGLSRASGEFEPGAPRVMGPEGKVVEGQAVTEAVARPTPDLSNVENVTAIRDRAKEIGQEEAVQVFGEIENVVGAERLASPPLPGAKAAGQEALLGEEAIAARKERARGEWDWWTEGQIDEGTRKRLIREGWVPGRTRGSIKVRYVDNATGKIKTRTLKGGAYKGGLAPGELAEFIRHGLGEPGMSVDDAMAWYVGAIKRLWDAESGRSMSALARLAEETGLAPEQLDAALGGFAEDYRAALTVPVEQHLDDLRQSYLNMSDEERVSVDLTVDAVMADIDAGQAGPLDLAEILQADFPELDLTGRGGIVDTFGEMVDFTDVVEWMRSGDMSPTMRAILQKRGPAQYVQLGRIAGEKGGLAQIVRETAAERRQAQADLRAAEREQAAAQRAAARNVTNTASVLEGRQAALDETAGLPRSRTQLQDAMEGRYGSTWQRGPRGAVSYGERIRRLQGQAEQRANFYTAKVRRLERVMRYRNDKIGNMRSELSRGMVDRLVNDVNRPWVTRARNIVRKAGEPIGRLRGRLERGDENTPARDTRQIDGLLGRLSKKYGFYDDLVEQIDASQRRDLHIVDDLDDVHGDVPPGSYVETAAVIFDGLLDETGTVLDDVDRKAYQDSVATDLLLEEISARELFDTQRGKAPNIPFRLREIISHGLRSLPDDIKSQFVESWNDYQRRRGNLLYRDFDKYVESVPAPYRPIAQQARRHIRTLLKKAEELNSASPGSGDVYIDMAMSTSDTLAEFVEADLRPVHLIGGQDVQYPYSPLVQGRMRKASVRAQKQRRSGLRALDPAAQARVEADQMGRVLHNELVDYIRGSPEDGGFGRRADDVLRDQIAAHRVATGENMSREQMAQAAVDAGWRSTEADGSVNEQTVLIPEQIAKQSDDYGFTTTHVWQWLTSGNRAWKNWVLPLSTKWLTGNIFGNLMSAGFYRGIGPLTLAVRMKDIARMTPEGWRGLWEDQGLPRWQPQQLASHGLGWRDYKVMYEPEETLPGTRLGRLHAKTIGRMIEWSYNLNEFTDNMTRAATYLELRRRGIPSDQAMNMSLKALGDFTRLSRLERRFVKEVIPFYPWLRHQTQATLRLPIESPVRAAWLMHLADLYTDPEESPELLSIIGTSLPIGGESFLDIGSISPMAELDPFRMSLSPTGIGRSISPFIRFPLAAATGLDLTTWDQIKRPATGIRRGPYGQETATPPWATILGGRPLQGLGELGYMFTQQAAPAQIRALRDIALGPNSRYATGYEIGSQTGRYIPQYRGNTLNQILRVAGVPSVRHIDLADARRRAIEQERRQRG